MSGVSGVSWMARIPRMCRVSRVSRMTWVPRMASSVPGVSAGVGAGRSGWVSARSRVAGVAGVHQRTLRAGPLLAEQGRRLAGAGAGTRAPRTQLRRAARPRRATVSVAARTGL